jgi:hypothetical protein
MEKTNRRQELPLGVIVSTYAECKFDEFLVLAFVFCIKNGEPLAGDFDFTKVQKSFGPCLDLIL